MRDQFARFVPEMVRNAISSLDSEPAQRALHAGLQNDEQLDGMLATIPPELRPLAAVFDSPEVRALFRALAANLIDEGGLATMVRSVFDHSRLEAMAQTAARGGQLSGMSNMLAQGVTPRTFDPRVWEVVRFSSGGLVLGDTCVIAVDEAGAAGSMLRMSDRWCASYLPISPTTVLVAWRGEPGRPLNEHALALASWELAEDYVYADRELPTVRHTAPPHSFGSRSEVMTDDELQALLANEWHDAAKR